MRSGAALVAALILSGCVSAPSPFSAGPKVAKLPISGDAATRALAAFRLSCPALLRRTDGSGLSADWSRVCAEAATATDPRPFFVKRFETVRVGDGKAFVTGYYEPEIAGSRVQAPGYGVPVYARPPDSPDPLPDRAAIDDGALAGKGLEIAWAADPVELFFLQIQGSGRLALPDGPVMRIGYAGQNGYPYTAIGALMRERGLIVPGQLSMQSIMAWLRAHPEEGHALMRENRSYVFFRELTGDGPVGALSVAVTPRTTVAADPAFTPLGAPVFLSLDNAGASGLWVAQDTGGAIKGANRFDAFWGAGNEARTIAGGLSARGQAWVLAPKGSLKRARHAPPAR
ncbi:MAG: MltA domain-containing protein [Sphingomonadaceae bacterium]|nr:MltA domain-containing protein [Sphingomonadaceae bacterium]